MESADFFKDSKESLNRSFILQILEVLQIIDLRHQAFPSAYGQS